MKKRNCPVCEEISFKKINKANNIDIVRCKNCSMVYANLEIKEIEDKNIYEDKSFYGYIRNEPVFSLAYYDNLLDKIIKYYNKTDLKILEFGCGAGLFLRRARKKGLQSYGSDFSPYAQKAKQTFGLNIEIENIFDTKFQENFFDVIYTHATHEHLGDMRKITEKLLSLLKNNGLLIISGVPNYNNMLIKFFNSFYKNNPPSHVNFFEKKTLKYFFDELSLKTLKIKTYGLNISMLYYYYVEKKHKKAETKKNSEIFDTEISVTDRELTNFHKLIAFVYTNFNIPNMGWNIEGWAVK